MIRIECSPPAPLTAPECIQRSLKAKTPTLASFWRANAEIVRRTTDMRAEELADYIAVLHRALDESRRRESVLTKGEAT